MSWLVQNSGGALWWGAVPPRPVTFQGHLRSAAMGASASLYAGVESSWDNGLNAKDQRQTNSTRC